jgi:hypothetical protein
LVHDEFIGVLRFNVVDRHHLGREILQVVGHDGVRVPRDRRGQDVAVIGIG